MKKIIFLIITLLSIGITGVYAQPEPQPEPPQPGQPQPEQGEGKKKDPLEILSEIQKRMEEIQKDLSQGSLGETTQFNQEKVREEIEKLLKEKDKQKDVSEKLEKLMRQYGTKQEKIAQEIEKLMKACNSQEKLKEALDKLMEDLSKQQDVIKKLDSLFENTQCKQKEVIEEIQKIIKMAKPAACSGGSQSKEELNKKPKDKDKEKDKDKDKDPKNAKKEEKDKQKEKDPKETYDPKDKKSKDQKNPPPDDNERWGDLPPKVREYMNAVKNLNLPTKYRDQILDFYTRIAKMKKNKE